jgi:hypothetical protein
MPFTTERKTSSKLLLLNSLLVKTGLRLGDVRKITGECFCDIKTGRACANFLTPFNYDWSLPAFIDSYSSSPIGIQGKTSVQRFDPMI